MKFDNDDGSLLALGALTLLAGAGAVATARGSRGAQTMHLSCRYCGEPMLITEQGISHHIDEDGRVDYDADLDHVAVADDEYYEGSAARGTPIAVGDGVQYKAAFLRSISEVSGPLPFAKGTVTKIDQYGSSFAIATIDWNDDEIPPRVNVNNLKRIKDWEPN